MKIKNLLIMICLMVVAAACNNKEMTNEQKIAGDNSKTWNAKKEYNASGKKEKLDKQEKKETMKFFANGKFTMQSENDAMNGNWKLTNGGTNLSLAFDGAAASENFEVIKLEKDNIRLKAGDGSEMILDAE